MTCLKDRSCWDNNALGSQLLCWTTRWVLTSFAGSLGTIFHFRISISSVYATQGSGPPELANSLELTLVVGRTFSGKPIVAQRFPLRFDRNASYQTGNSCRVESISAALSARSQDYPNVPKTHLDDRFYAWRTCCWILTVTYSRCVWSLLETFCLWIFAWRLPIKTY